MIIGAEPAASRENDAIRSRVGNIVLNALFQIEHPDATPTSMTNEGPRRLVARRVR